MTSETNSKPRHRLRFSLINKRQSQIQNQRLSQRQSVLLSQSSENNDIGTPTEEVIAILNEGSSLHKVRSLDHFYSRRYSVDLHNMRLLYSPSRKVYFFQEIPYVDLNDIDEVRRGWKTDLFNAIQLRFDRKMHVSIAPKKNSLPDLKEEHCFSIVFENSIGPTGRETLDLVAPNALMRDLWVKGLRYLVAVCKNFQKENEYEYWLKQQFKKADANGNGSLSFSEVLMLLNQLNISMHKKHARALFNVANTHKYKLTSRENALNPDDFLKFYQLLVSRPELDSLFKKYSINSASIMGPEELLTFLKKEQKMTKVSLADAEAYIKRYEPEETQVPGYLSVKGFQAVMMSIDFNIFNRSHRIVAQDMSLPMTQYYIASSHNTYLMNGQIIGESSVEGYIKALTKGCRCVELDVWDGENDEPIVFHGHTFTSKIYFRDILEAIKNYAFKTSQFPVILSLETHCSLEQQKKMASHLIETLGDNLHRTPVADDETEWPSPEELARKILVKGKKLASDSGRHDVVSPQSSIATFYDDSEEEKISDDGIADEMIEKRELSITEPNIDLTQASMEGNVISAAFNPKRKVKIARELSDLVTYCASRKFVSWEECIKKWSFTNMVSFSETKSENLAETNRAEYARFNKKHMSRVYPRGTRTDSSNYSPLPHWNVGSQLVALNYQTWSKPMLFNEALFSLNGKCGYVLKPEFLRKGKEYGYSPRSSVPNTPTNKPKKVIITIISGQHIPKQYNSIDGEVVDPYVKIKVYGHPSDKVTYKTKYVKNNGFNPIWDETFEFIVRIPELAFIYFVVKDHCGTSKDVKLGQYILPFRAIMEGYRHVNLYDENNSPIVPASIFVKVSMVDIADSWSPS